MSSFVIDKRDFVRVGAFVAGVAKATADDGGSRHRLWIWNYDKHLPMKGTDFVDKFVECWKLNVDSVCKQYNDNPDKYRDDEEYDDDYIQYFKYGRMIADDNRKLMDAVWDIVHFASSVSYQIEDRVSNQIVNEWFNMVIVELTRCADIEERGTWGSFYLDVG